MTTAVFFSTAGAATVLALLPAARVRLSLR